MSVEPQMDLKTLDRRIRHEHAEWHGHYARAIRRVEEADRATFTAPDFQRWLWTQDNAAIGIGLGSTVTVEESAFTDPELVEALWAVKAARPDADEIPPAEALAQAFDTVLKRVRAEHAKRRPKARVVRIFALLRPAEVTCMVWDERLRRVLHRLGVERLPRGTVPRHVLIQRRLRDLLGDAAGRADALAWRSILSWQMSVEDPLGEAEEGEAQDRLEVRRASAQLKGIGGFGEGLDVLLDLLRRVEPGIERNALVDDIRVDERYANWSNTTIQAKITLLKTLQLAHKKEGELRCTDNGRDLLDGHDAAEILAPFMIARVLGFAVLLDQLRDGVRETGPLAAHLQSLHPGWNTDFAPRVLMTWAKVLGLVQTPDWGFLVLTEAGRDWAERLPPRETLADLARPAASPEPMEDAVEVVAPESAPPPTLPAYALDEIEPGFLDAGGRDLILEDGMLAVVHAALHAGSDKRFVILGGLSGTGKTSFARAYSQAVCAAHGVADHRLHRAFVAVRPDWADPSGLLGYATLLSEHPRWHRTPALELLLRAARQPAAPHFLILEEMNLARVEHYMAPLLAAMENPRAGLRLHGEPEPVDGIPPLIRPWPANLYIIGTVNMDATTHAFSDKVLDRAFAWETSGIEPDRWQALAAGRDPVSPHLDAVHALLAALYGPLESCGRHFGYRVCDEVLGFCDAAGSAGPQMLDAAVFSKVLPRLRGVEGTGLADAIEAVREVCEARGLDRCASKLDRMKRALADTGLVRFWS